MKKIMLLLTIFLLAGFLTNESQAHGPHFRGPRIVMYPWFYPYSHYPAPRVIVQPAPLETPSYWYYCENPKGYYPYVKDCPYGWMKVVPETTAPPTDR
ncbi:MAG: hypothetical protein WA151_12400 [Desulfatirhabdiaceae bacterium]